MKQKTTTLTQKQIKRNWHLVDLSGKTLGRVCTEIAELLMGKTKANFSYHLDNGDYVIAINAAAIETTGKKLRDKIYYHHSAFAGGMKSFSLKEMMLKDPKQVIYRGVLGMLPKNKLRDRRMTRLKIFIDSQHPYSDKI